MKGTNAGVTSDNFGMLPQDLCDVCNGKHGRICPVLERERQHREAEQAVIVAARRLERAIASPPTTYTRGDIKRSKAEIDAAIDDILSAVAALDALETQHGG